MFRKFPYYLVVIVALYSCSPSTTSRTSKIETYSEDLSVHRPEFKSFEKKEIDTTNENTVDVSYPSPKYDVTEQLNAVLDSIDRIKADVKFVDGYTIQVYSGTNSEEAKIARGKVYTILDNASPSLRYEEPTFKVKVGKFYTRIEAQETYTKLRGKFPKSIIIPERIYLKNIDR